ncbi:MAG: polysaccharide biosynthesis protein, partial [Clostridia bacterium]
FVGLRPGEKLYEEMLMNEEGLSKTANNKIFIGHQIELDKDKFVKELEKMRVICETNNKDDIIAQLQALVPTFHHDAAFRQEQKLAEAMCREKTL